MQEAKKNREEAQRLDEERAQGKKAHQSRTSGGGQSNFFQKSGSNKDQPKLVGGIFFNPVPLEELNREHNEGGNSLVNNFFTKRTQVKQDIKVEVGEAAAAKSELKPIEQGRNQDSKSDGTKE